MANKTNKKIKKREEKKSLKEHSLLTVDTAPPIKKRKSSTNIYKNEGTFSHIKDRHGGNDNDGSKKYKIEDNDNEGKGKGYENGDKGIEDENDGDDLESPQFAQSQDVYSSIANWSENYY